MSLYNAINDSDYTDPEAFHIASEKEIGLEEGRIPLWTAPSIF